MMRMNFGTSANAAARVAVVLVAVVALIGGCGGSSKPQTPPPSAALSNTEGSHNVVLSEAGAQHIGLQLAPARPAGSSVVIPYSALVYDQQGNTYAFMRVAPFTYSELKVTIQRISGNRAYVRSGPTPGAEVVTVGAEELYGVASGVLGQT
jgi:hypothetical protein